MNEGRTDERLRARFEALRAEDRERAPDFSSMITAAREEAEGSPATLSPHRWKGRWTLIGGGLAAAAAVLLMLIGPGDRSDRRFEDLVTAFAESPALGSWRSPTDHLLDVPGSQVVTTIPTIGGYAPLTTPGLGPTPQIDTL